MAARERARRVGGTLHRVLCAAVLVVVSAASHAPDAARVEPLTIKRYRDSVGTQSATADIAFSALLAGLVAAVWLYFS